MPFFKNKKQEAPIWPIPVAAAQAGGGLLIKDGDSAREHKHDISGGNVESAEVYSYFGEYGLKLRGVCCGCHCQVEVTKKLGPSLVAGFELLGFKFPKEEPEQDEAPIPDGEALKAAQGFLASEVAELKTQLASLTEQNQQVGQGVATVQATLMAIMQKVNI